MKREFSVKEMLLDLKGNDLRVSLNNKSVAKVKKSTPKIAKWSRLNSYPLEFIIEKYPESLKEATHLKSGVGVSHSKIVIPKVLDSKLAYLLGALRDGSLMASSGKHWVRVYDTSESKWLEKVKPLFEKTFEVKLHLRCLKRFKSKYLDISSKPMFHFLNKLVEGNLHGKVPNIIKNSSMTPKKAYIAGFFDAEGHVPHANVRNKRYRITFAQKNIGSLEFIKTTLENLGIKSAKITNHTLPIYGRRMLLKFYKEFKLLNPEKSKRLKVLINESTPV